MCALPHCTCGQWVVGSATSAMHCHTAWGQWAVQLLQCTATLPGGSGQCNSCNAWAHQLGGRLVLSRRRSLPTRRYSCNAMQQCLGPVGGATPGMQCLAAWGQWAVEHLQCTASLLGGGGSCNSYNALPHCLGAVGSATPATHCLTAWGQWVVQLLQCTATPPGGNARWNSCNARAHQLGGRGVLPRRRSLP